MSDRPSDRAIAIALRELRTTFSLAYRMVTERAREIDTAAPEGAQAVACHRTITENGAKWAWIDGPPSLGALDNLKVHPAWKIEYAYTAPPSQDAEDAAKWRALNRPWVPTARPPRADGACSRCGNCRRGDFAHCKNRQYFDPHQPPQPPEDPT